MDHWCATWRGRGEWNRCCEKRELGCKANPALCSEGGACGARCPGLEGLGIGLTGRQSPRQLLVLSVLSAICPSAEPLPTPEEREGQTSVWARCPLHDPNQSSGSSPGPISKPLDFLVDPFLPLNFQAFLPRFPLPFLVSGALDCLGWWGRTYPRRKPPWTWNQPDLPSFIQVMCGCRWPSRQTPALPGCSVPWLLPGQFWVLKCGLALPAL